MHINKSVICGIIYEKKGLCTVGKKDWLCIQSGAVSINDKNRHATDVPITQYGPRIHGANFPASIIGPERFTESRMRQLSK